jgi:predicted acyltransferase
MNSSPKIISPAAAAPAVVVPRLMSVDALRGFDMFWIVGAAALVRALGEMTPNAVTRFLTVQLEHATWEGVRFYDVIYPLFLFIVGVSIVFSLDKALAEKSRAAVFGRVLQRGLLLYGFNFLYNGGFTSRWPNMRVVSGVLAMIAVCYVLAALIYCLFHHRVKVIAAITVGLLLSYWALFAWMPFPDFRLEDKVVAELAARAGSNSPAAVSAVVTSRISGVYEAGYNLSNWLDYRFIPGAQPNKYYENQGLLSPLCAVTICLGGILAGRLLGSRRFTPPRKALWLALAGLGAVVLGAIWGLEFPLIKRLWTSSFCLLTAGYSALGLAAFYLVVDVWQFRKWCQPFVWIGTNAITVYLIVVVVSFGRLAERFVGGEVKAYLNQLAPGSGALLVAFVALGLVFLFARFLYQRKIFLRV